MKFMKLGSKPDAFQSDGNDVRFVVSELPSDVIVHVGEMRFFLHKFPLLSKSNRLQRLVLRASEESTDEVSMHDFPGGPIAFEICAKFCYGMTVILNAYNVVAARCAAEYLEMTEDVEKGNLIFKIEVFLNSSIFRSWKDSIIVLMTTKSLLPWSEELKVVGRCIDCIASKISVDPANVTWSYTYNKKSASTNEIVEIQQGMRAVPKDWWIEDICELEVDPYKRVMIAVKSKGRMPSDVIGEALKAYAVRWLPDSYDALVSDDYTRRNRILVETIIHLLPPDKGSGCSCRFLLKLLRVVILVGAGDELKEDLMDRISVQLHKASVKDLLLPAKSSQETVYDVHLVQDLVYRFVMQAGDSQETNSDDKDENGFCESSIDASMLAVGKLVDSYLSEIASDPNISVSSFLELSALIPDPARPVHDGLYTAIDIYLKEHPDLSKDEKKMICGLMDVKKLSPDASIHAAKNERLPLRVVVQVLFFEQLRAAASRSAAQASDNFNDSSQSRANLEDWEDGRALEHQHSLRKQLGSLRIRDESRSRDEKKNSTSSSRKDKGHALSLQPSRSRRIFDKFWLSKAQGETTRSSETSGSSQSPPVSVNPGEAKPSVTPVPPLRERRYSVS